MRNRFKSLHLKYLQYIGDEQSNYSVQSLQAKILDRFPMMAIAKASNEQEFVVHNQILYHDDAIGIAFCDGHKIRETALYIRSVVIETINRWLYVQSHKTQNGTTCSSKASMPGACLQ